MMKMMKMMMKMSSVLQLTFALNLQLIPAVTQTCIITD